MNSHYSRNVKQKKRNPALTSSINFFQIHFIVRKKNTAQGKKTIKMQLTENEIKNFLNILTNWLVSALIVHLRGCNVGC